MVWGGGAPDSPHVVSKTPERQEGMIGLQYAWDWASHPGWRLQETVDLIPFFLIHQPDEHGSYTFSSGATRDIAQDSHSIWGAGASPLGLRLLAWPQERISPYVDGTGGFMLATERIPYQVAGGTWANFTYSAGAGLRIRAGKSTEVSLGYRWFHISNAKLSVINPGIDANLFYLGLSLP
jgi:hypothetical protein